MMRPEDFQRLADQFRQRHPFQPFVIVLDSGERIAIRITPTRDLPDGFASAPGTKAPPLEAAQ